ncbi:unnamed protein product, partial [Mesorhabditis belari]|uniref:Alcohol dehydrogenase n=1 Tax=Mesorhabditis belari TaxID=2138241 RepID=A0AAF3JAR0_9BILA
MSSTEGKVITCRAAVCWGPKNLTIEEVQVDIPHSHELRIKVLYNALCHTDVSVIEGLIDSALYPAIVGHECTGVVESIGDGVQGFEIGDHVILTPLPQCKNCSMCARGDTNFCERTNIAGVTHTTEDGSTRFTCKGKKIHHAFGCTAFSEYTVVRDINLGKINSKAPMEKSCLAGCGLATGYGAAVNTAQIKKGETVAIFGGGCIGLSAVLGAKHSGASEIFLIDINPTKFPYGEKMGATKFVNPNDCPKERQFSEWFKTTYGAVDKAIEAAGNVKCQVQAVEIVKIGWGRAVILGAPPSDHKMELSPWELLNGKTVVGGCVGDYHVCDDLPKLVEKIVTGEINVDPLITQKNLELDEICDAVKLMNEGKCIRAVFKLARD